VAGFGSGLTGVGGAVCPVPIMVLFHFPSHRQSREPGIQIIAAVSGTVAQFQYGSIDFRIAALVALFEVLGVYFGVRIVHAVNAQSLRRFVAVCAFWLAPA